MFCWLKFSASQPSSMIPIHHRISKIINWKNIFTSFAEEILNGSEDIESLNSSSTVTAYLKNLKRNKKIQESSKKKT